MTRILIALLWTLAAAWPSGAAAQDWPTRPITMVVPFPAGGPIDFIGRLMAQRLSEKLGQQVIVENVGGAGGMNGAARVAKSPPDGSTFLFGNQGTHTFSQILYKKPLYNAVADFAPVAVVVENVKFLATRKDFPAKTLPEFIAYARANQKTMQYGSAGIGSATHATCVLLNHAAGVDITHVPYRGTGPALQDMIAGRIDYMCEVTSTGAPHVAADAIKALAILSPARNKALPGVPTAHEQGLANFDADGWNAFFLPRGTPNAIVRKLADATSSILDAPDIRARLEKAGLNVAAPQRRNPDYLGKLVASELDKWGPPVRASGASAE
ncbi:MAG: tripartite tricarboxylate transporter substrate binding protein BugD [Rhizobiales bacterium]|nr:tripartite tricarboxylate transporter substrate binding protein BugD [Hyphomicrobiales bacterium]